jgi:hypothetical protein
MNPMLQKLKKVKHIAGVPVGAVKINLFVMVHTGVQISSQQSLPLKKLKRFTCVVARKPVIDPCAMEVTQIKG